MLKQVGIGAAITAALFLGGWLYGQYQYKQGVNAEKVNAVLSQIAIEQGMQYEKDRADAEYRQAVLEREAAQKLVSDQRVRIVGLLNDLRNAQASDPGSGPNDAGADGIGILIECIGDYEQMGAEAARLADKVNGLQGYVKAFR
ncbi:hypothetical protein GGR41_000589 [Paenalcaligenes hominis]|uniref:Lysozyme n=1 Tax=Paenalcaligenes hominis TaxID=643674 RepID=A0ABX0WPP1_9BURK|nr:hypothetical protein [Paenalcaligenes hominis]NJB64368.1 hypothetical protein [Paenalcaligenes hominis]GGE68177.1 hypothetical protein GCM10007278_15340 [Paenalcaligenes hominis]